MLILGIETSCDETGVALYDRRAARLLAHAEGLIALTGGGDGALAPLIAEGKGDVAIDALKQLSAAFGARLYVELQRHGELIEAETEGPLLDMAYDLGLPIVATNDIRFEKRSGHGAHDALMCIAASSYLGEEDRPRVTPQHYFRSADEMRELFSDLPEAIENTTVIARRIGIFFQIGRPSGTSQTLFEASMKAPM